MTARTLLATSLGGLPVQINPLARDYETFRTELIALAQQLCPEWTDFYEGDPGVVLLELQAMLAGSLSYHGDRILNESTLLTAQERFSVVQLLRLIGYELSPAAAASVPLTVVTDQAGVVLPKGYAVESVASPSTPSERFELPAQVVLALAGTHTTALVPGLVAIHGQSVDAEALGVSDGAALQTYALAQNPIALNPGDVAPLVLRVNGVQWTYAASFLGQESTDQVFTVQISSEGTAVVRFGDGVSGAIPTVGHAIVADYRVGGGAAGNSVGSGTLVNPAVTISGVVSVTNPTSPSGGTARETLAHAKVHGPLSLRALDRAVTLEDFETLAQTVPGGGVSAARADHTRSAVEVVVYVAASGANPIPAGKWYPEIGAGTGLIGAVGRWLESKRAAPGSMRVEPPIAVTPYLEAEVKVLPNVLQADVQRSVEHALYDLVAESQASFGAVIPRSRVDQVIEAARGVHYVNLNALHRKPAVKLDQGGTDALSQASFVFAMAAQVLRYRYEIRWLSPAIFELRRDGIQVVLASGAIQSFVAGTLASVSNFPTSGLATVADEIAQFDLTVTLGAAKPAAGDRWSFGTDVHTGNLALEAFEILVATTYPDKRLDPSEFLISYTGGLT